MIKVLLTGIMVVMLAIAKGQSMNTDTSGKTGQPRNDTNIHHVITLIEQEASFPGGNNRLFSFIRRNLRSPEEARKKGLEGVVTISFFVEKDGRLEDVKVEKSVSPELDAEAVRVIKSSPVWFPAIQNSKAVRQSFKVPVTFKIN